MEKRIYVFKNKIKLFHLLQCPLLLLFCLLLLVSSALDEARASLLFKLSCLKVGSVLRVIFGGFLALVFIRLLIHVTAVLLFV